MTTDNDHKGSTDVEVSLDGNSESDRRNARIGLRLFAVYLALYGGFMAINVIDPTIMAQPFVAGVNLAIVYGFVLIAAALGLALVYMWLCRKDLPTDTSSTKGTGQ